MGQKPCTPEEFIDHPIFPHLISISDINKVIMRSKEQHHFDSEGYPIGEPNKPIWFTDETGISTYSTRSSFNIIKKYKFKKDTNYNLINLTNVIDPNDFYLLTDIKQNINEEKMLFNQELMKKMVDCLIRQLKNSGEMNSNGQIRTKLKNIDTIIREEQININYKNDRGKDTLVETYLFTKLFEELDKYGMLDRYNIIGFYNGVSVQNSLNGNTDLLPSEIVILQKYVRDCMEVLDEDRTDDISNSKKRKRGGTKRRRRQKKGRKYINNMSRKYSTRY